MAQEGFLELINNMLTSGMVPALFPDDEKETIIGQVSIPLSQHYKLISHPHRYVMKLKRRDCRQQERAVGHIS